MTTLIKFFVMCLLTVFSYQIKASHFAGSDLTYKCLGGNVYQVTLTFYRDCSGAFAPSTVSALFFCDSNYNYHFYATLNAVPGTGQLVTPTCNSMPTTCNGGTEYGIQEHTYQGNVTLMPCNSWTISYDDCCRNPVTTVANNHANSWFVYARLNNLDAPCNNSPIFADMPTFVVNSNHNICLEAGLQDVDGDSLSVSLVPPHTSNTNTFVTYIPPYSATTFLSSSNGISLNPLSGDICFNSTSNIVTVYCLKVEEWRKINGTYMLIGTIIRDSQLKIATYLSSDPQLGGLNSQLSISYNPNDTIYTSETCVGNVFEFTINGQDTDIVNYGNTNFSLSWSNEIQGASFTAINNGTDSTYGYFSWIPNGSDVKPFPHCFYIKITDQDCPYFKSVKKKYCLKVNPPINPPFIGNDTTICINHSLLLDAGNADSYLWFNGDTTKTTLIDASTLGTGTFPISVTIAQNGCKATSSFNLTVDACIGIKPIQNSFDFALNPNPNSGQFNLSFSQKLSETLIIEIFSPTGQSVYKKEIPRSDQKTISVDLKGLAKGVYYIRITNGLKDIFQPKTIVIQ